MRVTPPRNRFALTVVGPRSSRETGRGDLVNFYDRLTKGEDLT